MVGAALLVAILAIFVFAKRKPGAIRGAAGDELGFAGSGGAALRGRDQPRLGADDPTGVRLTGFVIDGAGSPVVGAEVTAELEKGVVDRGLTPTPTPAKSPGDAGSASSTSATNPSLAGGATSAAAVWDALGGNRHGFVAAPTGLDGRFAIGGLTAGRYRLHVTGPDLLPAELRFVPVPSDATRIVVARQVAIAGIVLDEGKPAAKVTIGLRGDAIGGGIERKSATDGTFTFSELPEGRYQLFAYQGALAARAVRVNRLGSGPFAPIELRLEPATIVVGRVIDRDEGTGVVSAIELRPAGDDQAPRYARSGDDGVFRIEGVPNGRWIADAYAPGYLSSGGIELEAGKGVPEMQLVRGATVSGHVVDAEGKPIAGATVRALVGGGGGPGTPGAEATEVSESVEQDKLRRYSGIVVAQAPAMRMASSGGDPNFLMRGELGVMVGPIPPLPAPGAAVARAATLDPTVATLAPEPAPLVSEPTRAAVWTTGADGAYRIRGIARGKVRVLAVAPGYAEGRSKQLVVEGAQVIANVDVVLSAGTFVVGKVTDQRGIAVVGAQLTATPEVGAALETFSAADGMYRVGPLDGNVAFDVSAYGHGVATRAVELEVALGQLAAEHREDFTLVVADATLAGVLDDANGSAVGGAQLEVTSGAGDGRGAVTANDGTFSIDMLPAGPLRVRIRHPAYPTIELDTTATTTGARARLVMPLGGAIEGAAIEAASGAPLTSIVVVGDGPGNAAAEATTDRSGRWRLGPLVPGAWKVRVKLPGFLPNARSVEVTAARAPDETSVRDVLLELARGALIGGTVRDARGNRLPGAAIRVHGADGTVVEGASDQMGEFRLRDAPTGEVVVGATHGDMRGSVRATVRPGDEILGLSIDVR